MSGKFQTLDCLLWKNIASLIFFAESTSFYCTFSVSLQIERFILRGLGHFCTRFRCCAIFNAHLQHRFVVMLDVKSLQR